MTEGQFIFSCHTNNLGCLHQPIYMQTLSMQLVDSFLSVSTCILKYKLALKQYSPNMCFLLYTVVAENIGTYKQKTQNCV